jgi:hypothetical protein
MKNMEGNKMNYYAKKEITVFQHPKRLEGCFIKYRWGSHQRSTLTKYPHWHSRGTEDIKGIITKATEDRLFILTAKGEDEITAEVVGNFHERVIGNHACEIIAIGSEIAKGESE